MNHTDLIGGAEKGLLLSRTCIMSFGAVESKQNETNCLSKRPLNNKFVLSEHHSFFDTDKEITT